MSGTTPDNTPIPTLSTAETSAGDPLKMMMNGVTDRLDYGRAARLALTERVTTLEARAPVPGPKGDRGAAGKDGADGKDGAAGTPRRVETYTGTSNASGVGTITFSPAFAAPPQVIEKQTWVNGQMVSPAATVVTVTGCTLTVMRSRATLLLTSGPFEAAPNTAFSIVAIG